MSTLFLVREKFEVWYFYPLYLLRNLRRICITYYHCIAKFFACLFEILNELVHHTLPANGKNRKSFGKYFEQIFENIWGLVAGFNL